MNKLFLALGFLLLLASCAKDEDTTKDEISGKWNVTSILCFSPPMQFEKGKVVWEFNTSTQKLKVTKEAQITYAILDSGSYDFTVLNAKVKIDGVEYDYSFEDGKLILTDHPEVDGPTITLERD